VRITDLLRLGHPAILRDETMPVPIDGIDQGIPGFAEPSGCPRDSTEHGLNVVRRTRDRGEDRADGRLR
jgi:hypothetical protein